MKLFFDAFEQQCLVLIRYIGADYLCKNDKKNCSVLKKKSDLTKIRLPVPNKGLLINFQVSRGHSYITCTFLSWNKTGSEYNFQTWCSLGFYTALFRYTFCNQNDVTVRVIDYGCVITDILVPDKEGVVSDVSLGYDSVQSNTLIYTLLICICTWKQIYKTKAIVVYDENITKCWIVLITHSVSSPTMTANASRNL